LNFSHDSSPSVVRLDNSQNFLWDIRDKLKEDKRKIGEAVEEVGERGFTKKISFDFASKSKVGKI